MPERGFIGTLRSDMHLALPCVTALSLSLGAIDPNTSYPAPPPVEGHVDLPGGHGPYDDPAPSARITFDEALGLAAETPSVRGAARALSVKQEANDKLWPLAGNPTLYVKPGVATSDKHAPLEGEAGLFQSFNLAGLPGARSRAVRAEADVLRDEARAAALSRRLEAAQAWLDLRASESALALAREELALASELALRTRKAAEKAALTRADAAEADAYEAEARLLALSVEGEVTDLGYRLSGAIGRGTAEPVATAGELPMATIPPQDAWERLVSRAKDLPAPRAERLAAEADRARAVEARASRGLELQLGLLAQRDAAGRNVALAQVGFTLPVFDRGHREAGVADAAAARKAGDAEDAARRAATELARAFHEVEHSGEVLVELERGLLPAAVESARLREAALRAGEATVLETLVARRNAAAAKGRQLRARAAHAWARVKVALLVSLLPNETGVSK